MNHAIRRYWPLFVLPTVLAFLIGFLVPFVMGLYLSLCQFTTVSDATFVGLDNYVRAFTDPSSNFLHAMWYTALFAFLSTLVINLAGLTAAV